MTKKDIIKFLEPFDDEIEVRASYHGIAYPSKMKYIPTEEYAYVVIMEDV